MVEVEEEEEEEEEGVWGEEWGGLALVGVVIRTQLPLLAQGK